MSRLKRHQNPHIHTSESLRVVRRHELAGDLLAWPKHETGDEKNLSQDEAIEAMNTLLAPLHREFMRAIGTRKHKRKRSASPTEELGATQTEELRLLTLQPMSVSICEQSEGWQGKSRQLPLEDTEKEELERKYRAELAAVDVSLLLKQSSIVYPAVKANPVVAYKTKGNPVIGPTVITESLKAPPISAVHCHFPQCQLRSRDPKPKADLVVPTHSPYEKASKPRTNTPIYSFYHSTNNIGGKSAGYAWGYPGSHPRPSHAAGYVRDTMKKGLDDRGNPDLAGHMARIHSDTRRGRSTPRR